MKWRFYSKESEFIANNNNNVDDIDRDKANSLERRRDNHSAVSRCIDKHCATTNGRPFSYQVNRRESIRGNLAAIVVDNQCRNITKNTKPEHRTFRIGCSEDVGRIRQGVDRKFCGTILFYDLPSASDKIHGALDFS